MRSNRPGLTAFLIACVPSVTLGQADNSEAEFERSSVPVVVTEDADNVGTAGCLEPPCSVCPGLVAAGSCQPAGGSVMWSIDPLSGGGAVADDFIAESTQITEFCYSSCFVGVGNTEECPDPPGWQGFFLDRVSVRFFEDGADDSDPVTPPGFPGAPLPGSPGLHEFVRLSWKELRSTGFQCWDYSIVFDPPITGMTAGRRYWVEWFSEGWRDDQGNGCEVFLEASTSGNGWALRQLGQLAYSTNPEITSVHAWKERTAGGDLPQDWPFCIDGGLTVPPAMTGACCACDGTCVDGVVWEDCIASSAIDAEGNVFALGDAVGTFFPTQSCSEIACQSADPDAPGEECGNPIVLESSLFDFTELEFSNLCSTTDGPEVLAACGEGGDVATGNDVWLQFNSSDTRVEFDVCGEQLDVVMAIYTNGTSTCPHELGECPPSESDRVFCTAGTCPGGLVSTTSCWGRSTCKGGPNDGEPCFPGDDDCPDATCTGQCYLIRLSGEDGDVGTGHLRVWSYHTDCPYSSPVVQEVIGAESAGTGGPNIKERFLSFSAGDPDLLQAIRVTVDSVTEPHHAYLVGSEWWVQGVEAVSESGASVEPRPGASNFWAAPLGCMPHVADWNGVCDVAGGGQCVGGLRDAMCFAGPSGSVCTGGPNDGDPCSVDSDCPGDPCTQTADCGGGVLHVHGEAIVPGASYSVLMVANGCDPGLLENGSPGTDSMTIETATFGDVTSLCNHVLCLPSGNGTSVDDILVTIAGFASAPGAPSKTRTESEPSAIDFYVNITDVLMRIRAFTGLPYPALRCDGQLGCVGGPHHGESCTTDLDCRLELCPHFASPICSGVGGG